jgi:hypothetical protein
MSERKVTCPKCGTEISVNDKDIDELVQKQLFEKEFSIRQTVKKEVETEQQQLQNYLKQQLAEKDEKLTMARTQQVELLKEQAKLKEEKDAFEIDKLKQLANDRLKIAEEENKKATAQSQFQIDALNKKLADAIRVKDELARKLEQGSQQSQGEIAELNIQESLKTAFIYDDIQPVKKGVNGADIIQIVHNTVGKDCGSIIWEVKNTKNWTEGWIQKLKEDQRTVHADVAIIVSSALPKGITTFSQHDGVWICSVDLYISLATLIRDKLEAIAREKGLSVSKNEKMEILYQYLSGPQFRQRVEAIAEAIRSMQHDLSKEKMYYEKKWAKTEQLMKKILTNTVGMYGDFEGMVNLPEIQIFELEYRSESKDGSQE